MATGNRLLICVIAVVVLGGMAAAFALDWSGKQGAGTYVALATAALGVLAPSALKQAGQGAGGQGSGDGASAPGGADDGKS